jgi:uncharacterized Zn-finger protein
MSHQQINSVGHLYYCDVCNKTFAVKSHVVRHLRLHSGECTVPVECAVRHSVKTGTC